MSLIGHVAIQTSRLAGDRGAIDQLGGRMGIQFAADALPVIPNRACAEVQNPGNFFRSLSFAD